MISYPRIVSFVALMSIAGCNSTVSAPQASAPSPATAQVSVAPLSSMIFEDVTAVTGIEFTYQNGEETGHFAIIESLGGGVALFDYDRDGRLDIFFTGGGRYEGKNVLGRPCRLFRNLGDWHFRDVTNEVGLTTDFQYSHGVAAFDYDNDGWLDLLITGYSRLILLRNQAKPDGSRCFVDVTAQAGLNDRLWSSSAGWGDLDGDGFPELYIAHYGDWGFETNHPVDCTYDGKTRDVCQPRRFKPLIHSIYRNNRDGTFTDQTEQLKLRPDGRGLGVLFVDLDGDRQPDVYVANDTDDNFLYLNRSKKGAISLHELGLIASVARDDRGVANGSMGVDAADYARSGQPAVIVGNYENELPALYRNRSAIGQPRFIYATLTAGIASVGSTYVNWGTGFVDFDCDGWEDLLIVNGHAIRFPTKIDRRQKPLLFANREGRLVPLPGQGVSYMSSAHNARGAAFGDLDNDGRVDVVVSHLNEPVVILKNATPTSQNHWVGIELVGKNHRDVVGARVVIESGAERWTRFQKGGGSFASTSDRRLHFGLGGVQRLDKVTVHWPWGQVQEYRDLEMDRYNTLHENESEVQPVK